MNLWENNLLISVVNSFSCNQDVRISNPKYLFRYMELLYNAVLVQMLCKLRLCDVMMHLGIPSHVN